MAEPRIRISSRIARGISVGSSYKARDVLIGLAFLAVLVVWAIGWLFEKALAHWHAILAVVLSCGALVWYVGRMKREEDALKLAAKLEADRQEEDRERAVKILEKVSILSGKAGYAAKARAAQDAMSLLQPLLGNARVEEILGGNSPERLQLVLQSLINTYPVFAELRKAEKAQFAGDEAKEKKAILDALFIVIQDGIPDSDFAMADLEKVVYGRPITRAILEARARQLGWNGPSQ